MSKTSYQREYRKNMIDEKNKDVEKLEYINIIK